MFLLSIARCLRMLVSRGIFSTPLSTSLQDSKSTTSASGPTQRRLANGPITFAIADQCVGSLSSTRVECMRAILTRVVRRVFYSGYHPISHIRRVLQSLKSSSRLLVPLFPNNFTPAQIRIKRPYPPFSLPRTLSCHVSICLSTHLTLNSVLIAVN